VTPDRAALARLRHELRTPLNHIIGYSELLLEEVEGSGLGALAPGLHAVREDARRLLGLINEFLAPERVAIGGVDRGRVPAELSEPLEWITAVIGILREEAARSGDERLLPDLDRIASAAGHLLRQVRQGMAPAMEGPAPAVAPAGALATPAPPTAGSGTILVVDDNAENRDMLARRLEREGHEVHVAADGQEALDLLASRPVDLVLLDVMMPGLSGDEVLRRLKAEPRLRNIPVLMISALDEVEQVVRCIELGAEDYLPKPFDPVLLRARIGACLEKKRLRDQEVRQARELAEWNRVLEDRVREKVAEVERLGRLKRFFSPQLAELIVAGDAEDPLRTHRREITVVFLDLRGFTTFAETAEPEEVMGVLREYHAAMGKLIVEYEGTLERFTGDGMMVFFNDPVAVSDPAARAVRMALAMRERVRELGTAWRKRGYDLGLGVGIAQGYATLGAIGFEGRWDYAAIGTVTNLAARLCAEAKAGQILVTSRVAGAVDESVDLAELGALTLKGFLRPVPTLNVVGLRARR
jgi:class 3 adenylate cyclase